MGRIDYTKVRFQLPQGEAGQQWRARLDRHLLIIEGLVAHGIVGGHKVHTDYNPNLPHTTKYLEIWGDLANEYYERMVFELGSQDIMRLDYRQELPGEVDLNALAAKAETIGRRQFQKFNQRVREKSNDRSAGGFGLAKGSHKSERRVSVYKRASELPAAEIQLRGKKAAEFHASIRALFDKAIEENASAAAADPRDFIQTVGDTWLNDDLVSEVGMGLGLMQDLSASMPYDEAETRLATLDALWDMLSAMEKTAFVQAKLFGDDSIVFRTTK